MRNRPSTPLSFLIQGKIARNPKNTGFPNPFEHFDTLLSGSETL
jgi:hypothetical protein